MGQADGRDPGVMNPWAHDRTRLEQTRQRLDVSGPFAEEMDRGASANARTAARAVTTGVGGS
ncbi:MAG: hypothetical protein IPO89_00050 [Actinomycetales bacterium]|nr:hypothetical protein [Candidatus Lutibacillus vidarii]